MDSLLLMLALCALAWGIPWAVRRVKAWAWECHHNATVRWHMDLRVAEEQAKARYRVCLRDGRTTGDHWEEED